ncbi:MAG TPA: hypothetical protein VL424_03205, partial [Pararobbsia sp.]|nr:hypothetical protein [Pararobbsia sp.]
APRARHTKDTKPPTDATRIRRPTIRSTTDCRLTSMVAVLVCRNREPPSCMIAIAHDATAA